MDLAIVGAGAAGAAAAYALRNAAVDVVVFEADDDVGGRATTHESHGCRYDLGANYVKADSPRVSGLLTGALPTDDLVDVAEPVWTFDAGGDVAEGDDQDDHKWTYEAGIADLARRLLAETDAEVRSGTAVGRLARRDGDWTLFGDDGDLGTFDAVLLTPPAPLTADLLAATAWDDPLLADLRAAADAVPYRSVLSVPLGYGFEVEAPWYGLVNTDREHEIGWLSREELKPGHVPDGEALLVVQMAPDWSAERLDRADDEAVVTEVAAQVADLLDDERFADPAWTDARGWRFALPEEGADAGPLGRAESADLYAAGDWVAGDGRVHLAVESGLEAGERIAVASRRS